MKAGHRVINWNRPVPRAGLTRNTKNSNPASLIVPVDPSAFQCVGVATMVVVRAGSSVASYTNVNTGTDRTPWQTLRDSSAEVRSSRTANR